MTEKEWLECTDPQSMLGFLRGKASKRKLRLFLVSCSRLVWHRITNAIMQTEGKTDDPCYDAHGMAREMRRAVEVGELYADGLALSRERESCINSLDRLTGTMQTTIHQVARLMGLTYNHFTATYGLCRCTVLSKASLNVIETTEDWRCGLPLTALHQPGLLRDIFGNPFRPVSLDPSWLKPSVLRFAQATYDDRAFINMPILADALEEAGCTNADVLSHCRSEGPHVRGCWVVDLILGKR